MATETITPDTPTFPEGDSGFSPVSLFAYPELFTLQPGTVPTTFTFYADTLSAVSADEWQTVMNDIDAALSVVGYKLVAYGVWDTPLGNQDVPSQFCVTDWTCVTVPSHLCVPGTSLCLPLAGHTVVTAWSNQVWMAVAPTSAGSGLVLPDDLPNIFMAAHHVSKLFAGGVQARGFGFIALFAVIGAAALAASIGIYYIHGIKTGDWDLSEFVKGIQPILNAPGNNLKDAEAGIIDPIVALGALFVIGGILLPVLITGQQQKLPSASLGVTGPQGIGVSGSIGK